MTDLLIAGDERPPRPRVRRLWTAALLVVVLAAVAVPVLREQRAEREERRLQSVVDLAVAPGLETGGVYDRQADRVVLELLLQVRNEGPRPVTVLSGGVGGYGLARPVELPAGEARLLVFGRTASCRTTPPPQPPAETLELSVRTGAGVAPRRVELPLPEPVPDEAPLACTYLPAQQGIR